MATMPPDWASVPWYAKPNDLIGGWCIGVDERPPSKEGVWVLGDFMNEDLARHIVALHNQSCGPAPVTAVSWPVYLRASMAAAGIRSGSQLAERSGIDRSAISNWLNGKAQPAIPNLEKLKGPLGRPLLEMMVAAGLISNEDAGFWDVPRPGLSAAVDGAAQVIAEELRTAAEAMTARLRGVFGS